MEFNQPRCSIPKFQHNLLLNLLDREIGTEYRKSASILRNYRHPYQLLPAVRPNVYNEILFNDHEPSVPGRPPFTSFTNCLGFSPNGKYLAFHSNGRSIISVFTYSGLEAGKIPVMIENPANVFPKIARFDLTDFVRDYNYRCTEALGSWWTDDSTTLIVHLAMDGPWDEDFEQNEPEEDILDQANNLVDDRRGFWNIGNNLFQPNPSNIGEEDYTNSPVVVLNGRANHSSEEVNIASDLREVENAVQTVFEREPVGENSLNNQEMQQAESSRTIPFWLAMETAASFSVYGELYRGETSRTVPVVHALASAIIGERSVGIEEDVGEECLSIPSTSQHCHPPFPETKDKLNDKRVKEKITTTNELKDASIADQLQYELIFKDKQNSRPGAMRAVLNWIRKHPHSSKILGRDILERKENGYSSVGLDWRNSKNPNGERCYNYSDRLREMVIEQNTSDHNVDLTELGTDSEVTMVFIAYNVETNTVTPLFFENVSRKFHTHVRDRKLTVTYNTDLIETYQLFKEDNKWRHVGQTRLSKREPIPILLHYRPGTVPGMASVYEEAVQGDVLDDLFDINYFHCPIQQDIKTLLHRDTPSWVNQQNLIFSANPEVTRCHMVTDDILAVTMTFYNSHGISLRLGATVFINDSSITLYPDFHNFMKLLFKHHLPDLLPRQWTYLSPSPAHEQPWFKEGFIDISNADELNNYERLKKIYDFMTKNFNNVKSTSNPLSDSLFGATSAHDFMSKQIFSDGQTFLPFKTSKTNRIVHLERFYHPSDPLVVVNSTLNWFLALHRKDPDDVVVQTD